MPNCDYVRRYYEVPAEIGRRVMIDGKPGIITEDRGAYIGVVMDGDKATNIRPYHPTWKVEYLDMGTVPKLTRSQLRYRHYLRVSECYDDFRHYLECVSAGRKSPPA